MSFPYVLVVEDDDAVRRLLTDCLREEAGIEADVARDGAEALHRIRLRDYSVVLLDLVMPHMSGIDVLDSLHTLYAASTDGVSGPRVIVITSIPCEEVSDGEIRSRCPSAVLSVLRKPLDVRELVSRVTDAVGSRQ